VKLANRDVNEAYETIFVMSTCLELLLHLQLASNVFFSLFHFVVLALM
jgi:hypothetical protein